MDRLSRQHHGKAQAAPAEWIGALDHNGEALQRPAIVTFVLNGDSAEVRAALPELWSNGQAEGQIKLLELIKRQSYGRAGLGLLQCRMVLTA